MTEYVLKTRKSSLLVADQQPSLRDDTSDEDEYSHQTRVSLAPFTEAYYSSPYYQHLQGYTQQAPARSGDQPAPAQKALKRLRPSSVASVAAVATLAPPPPEPKMNTLSRVALSRIDKAMELFLEEDSVTVTGTLSVCASKLPLAESLLNAN